MNQVKGKPNIEAIYPLSPMQQGMLFHALYDDDPEVYFNQLGYRIEGALNVPALKQAWETVFFRHAILRTVFVLKGNKPPMQIVRARVMLPWADLDWSDLASEAQEVQLSQWLEQDRHLGFRIDQRMPIRLTLIRLGPRAHHFVWSLHHILMDGWCNSLILDEVFTYYHNNIQGIATHLPPPTPYRNYIAWLQKQDMADAETYWRRHLEGFDEPTPLPTIRPQSDAEPFVLKEVRRTMEAQVTHQLSQRAKQHQVTLNTLTLAVWALLLGRYARRREVVTGIVVSGRPPQLPGIEHAVGLFINTLPIRFDIDPTQELGPFLKAVQATGVSHRNYEFTPLFEVQRWCQLPQKQPIFESLFVFENFPIAEGVTQQRQDLEITDVTAWEKNSYPLSMRVAPSDELIVILSANESRFSGGELDTFLDNYLDLLTAIAEHPTASLERYSEFGDMRKKHVLAQLSGKIEPAYRGHCLHHLFTAAARRFPQAPALHFEGRDLTYQTLDHHAVQLAAQLAQKGIGLEHSVGICAYRSIEMVVAMLAVLKRGACYVPLDPEYPKARQSYLLNELDFILVTPNATGEKVESRVPHLEIRLEALAQGSLAEPQILVSPHNAAYRIYTSGSTGNPKGVVNTHEGICNRLLWAGHTYRLDDRDRIVQKTPFTFDVSVWEIFCSLLHGATLVIAKPNGHKDPFYLSLLMTERQVTTVHFVPSMLRLFLEVPHLDMPSLKRVLCSGEALEPELVNDTCARLGCEVHNLYGPTEAAVDVTSWTSIASQPCDHVPIGTAIDNVRMLVVDAQLNLRGPGIPGELLLGGVALARGYFAQPALTAQRFVPCDGPGLNDNSCLGMRWYRTGDLVSVQESGALSFLGRIDSQVKIRGFRIEPGEVEVALRKHPEVDHAAVVARQSRDGSAFLVAYVVAPESVLGDLEAFLKKSLPSYLVPSLFIALAQLPLTSSGKLDRKALPDPEPRRESSADTPLTGEQEVQLVEIWRHFLGDIPLNLNDDFFLKGGHSILATRMIMAVNDALSIQVPLPYFFQNPTIGGLISFMRGGAEKAAVLDLKAEVVLPEDLQGGGRQVSAHGFSPRTILLTGATGFVGAFLLDGLLGNTDAHIYCLIRGRDQESAKQRLIENLDFYRIKTDAVHDRVTVLAGDLGQPRLGLTDHAFSHLGARLDAIYHNGAVVNFAQTYSSLKPVNVEGCLEILRLASQTDTLVPIHFVSTISVISPAKYAGIRVQEETPLDEPGPLDNGYVQSKWVAERIFTQARDRGYPISIHRLGRISGHAQTGAATTTDMVGRILLGCLQLGQAPRSAMTVELVPVDYLIRAMLHVTARPKSLGQVFHYTNPDLASLATLFQYIVDLGYPMSLVPIAEWRASLQESVATDEHHPLYPLLHLLDDAPSGEGPPVTYGRENMERLIQDTDIIKPAVNAELIGRYLRFYREAGLLDHNLRNK